MTTLAALTLPRWSARISRVEGRWHRVELEAEPVFHEEPDPQVRAALELLLAEAQSQRKSAIDPRLEAVPVALVRQPELALAIAALPELLEVARLLDDAADVGGGRIECPEAFEPAVRAARDALHKARK